MMMGLITGGLLGATVGIYAVSNMSPKDKRRTMKRTKKMLSKAMMMNFM